MLQPFLQSIATLLTIQITNANNYSSLTLTAAKIGGCVDFDNTLIHCAATAIECESDDTTEQSAASFDNEHSMEYKSANELRTGDHDCTTDTLPVGTCESTGLCAVTKESCRTDADFRAPRPYGKCNAEGYLQNAAFVPTLYGGCKNRKTGDIVCVLTPEDCLTEEDWVFASDVKLYQQKSCRCHDVKVGLCASGNVLTSDCAISRDDCDPFIQTFNSARYDRVSTNVDCRLCPMLSSEQNEGGSSTTPPDSGPNTNFQDDIDMINEKEAGALHAGEIVGIVLGSLITAFFALIGLFIW
eukprot:CAMPEP_0198265804 /NCGR_PEP_ID=MMETSP1447-20131203/24750_1 /TAXON_ID=420782 /ORGANISM="Chaetoceros dichaeta, Strain CCMP1751" /LENGTH=298 /DNA_ID=CAMNT_0043955499 /DNA_START=62 /DNA_END=955 /DNA_ORIENTATION=-